MNTVIFDTETTGLPKTSSNDLTAQPYITEIYAVQIDEEFKILKEIDTLIKPPIPIPKHITDITSIDDAMLIDAPPFDEIWEDIANVFTGSNRMVAHNVGFDRSMLFYELSRINRVWNFPWPIDHLCTAELSAKLYGRRMSLGKLHEKCLGQQFSGAHRAKADVHALVRIYHHFIENKKA